MNHHSNVRISPNHFQSPKISPRMKAQIQNQRKARMSPLANTNIINNNKNIHSFSPGHWKNFVANDLINDQNQSKKSFSRNTYNNAASQRYVQNHQEQQMRKKQDIIKRVRQLQEKVLPMIQNQNSGQEQDFGWQGRIQQKLLKLQTAVDSLRKDMQIKMQRKIMEVQNKWEARFQQLMSRIQ